MSKQRSTIKSKEVQLLLALLIPLNCNIGSPISNVDLFCFHEACLEWPPSTTELQIPNKLPPMCHHHLEVLHPHIYQFQLLTIQLLVLCYQSYNLCMAISSMLPLNALGISITTL